MLSTAAKFWYQGVGMLHVDWPAFGHGGDGPRGCTPLHGENLSKLLNTNFQTQLQLAACTALTFDSRALAHSPHLQRWRRRRRAPSPRTHPMLCVLSPISEAASEALASRTIVRVSCPVCFVRHIHLLRLACAMVSRLLSDVILSCQQQWW